MVGCVMTGKVTVGTSPSSKGVLTDCSSGQLLSEDEALSFLTLMGREGFLELVLEGVEPRDGNEVLRGGEELRGGFLVGADSLLGGGEWLLGSDVLSSSRGGRGEERSMSCCPLVSFSVTPSKRGSTDNSPIDSASPSVTASFVGVAWDMVGVACGN